MKSFVILAFCAASVAANGYGQAVRVESSSYGQPMRIDSYGSAGRSEVIPIVRYNQDIRGSESDSVSFETGNGISITDNTQVVQGRGGSYDDGYGNMIRSNVVLTKQGSYSYTSPEGQHISTSWSADENGFRAEGAHLPRPVEMPADHAEAHRLVLSKVSSSSYGGSYEAPAQIRSNYEAPAVVRTSYEAPAVVRTSYEAPKQVKSSYEAPAIRVQTYEAPAQVKTTSYEAPTVVRTSYEAPMQVKSSYEAPAIRVQTYEAPAQIRSSYEAPMQVKTSSYEAPAVVRSSYSAPQVSIRTNSY